MLYNYHSDRPNSITKSTDKYGRPWKLKVYDLSLNSHDIQNADKNILVVFIEETDQDCYLHL